MLNSPDRSNTAALVTTYCPDAGLANRLASLKRILDAVLVVDNTGDDAPGNSLAQMVKECCIDFIPQPKNVGVAAALNQAATWALGKGLSWLLTMDQDSEPLPNLIELAGRAWGASPSNYVIGAIGTAPGPSATSNSQSDFVPATSVITSGTVINLEAWKRIGGFREDFFIDGVDEEYCLRLQRHGYKVIRSTKPGISHTVGNPSVHQLFGRSMVVTNHSATRRYYMTRNRIRLAIEYFTDHPRWIARYFFYSLKDFVRVLLFEHDRIMKVRAVILGVIDGLSGRMGPLRTNRLPAGPTANP